MSVQPTLSVGT